jgi:large repetitive protein
LQRVMNLTTVRTHQYAVWITVGFFEVKRQGKLAMIGSGDPSRCFDILGPEVGLHGDKNRRYRGFFLVDRLKLDGFNPTTTGSWHSAVVYRQILQ